jgi:acid stress-induced BolA-like protein IbaG/YrbA
MTLDELTNFLKTHFPNSSLIACSGSLYHVTIMIIDEQFEGLSPLKRHQRIYRALRPLIADQTLHALTLAPHTAEEYLSLS